MLNIALVIVVTEFGLQLHLYKNTFGMSMRWSGITCLSYWRVLLLHADLLPLMARRWGNYSNLSGKA